MLNEVNTEDCIISTLDCNSLHLAVTSSRFFTIYIMTCCRPTGLVSKDVSVSEVSGSELARFLDHMGVKSAELEFVACIDEFSEYNVAS